MPKKRNGDLFIARRFTDLLKVLYIFLCISVADNRVPNLAIHL